MPTHVLIVEGDAALSARMRSALEERGFRVEETTDGRTCIDLARRVRPACVVLAVDLPAGQNGYILCGKFKKDDELRTLPVAIVGNSEGFGQHSKLKNRADAYLAKPLQLDAFVASVAELTGEAAPSAASPEAAGPPPERDQGEEATVSGDPDLDLIDAVFDTAPLPTRPAAAPPSPPEEVHPSPSEDSALSSLEALGLTPAPLEAAPTAEPSDLDLYTPLPETAPSVAEAGDDGEALRRELARLQAALEDAQARSFASDVRINQLEAELAGRGALEDAQGGAESRPARDEVLRRDRELLRLKAEIQARDQELADAREQTMHLEQRNLELSGEMSRRDGQLKAVQGRSEQDRKRVEQAVEEAQAGAREAGARAVELQGAVEAASARADAAEQDAADLRSRLESAEGVRDAAEGELAAALRDRELNRAHADGAQRQLDVLRSSLEQAQADLAAAREQLGLRDAARDEEVGTLRQRVAELEAATRKHEERVARLYARLKSEERAREKARRAVAMAGQLLSPEKPAGEDEPASARGQ
jgi:CheY-like chemotaxis protein